MSYRELRDATEILRSLRYPRLVSMENFRYPNFALMAEVLEWVVRKFDPNVRMPRQIENEADRVLFVKSAVLTLLQKAHVRLNPKNIYQSDGHAIRELLPVLRMLYEGVRERQLGQQLKSSDGQESVQINVLRSQMVAKRQELRQTVQLAAELPKTGANLYELLREEVFAKEIRSNALGRSLNASQVEMEIRERVQSTEQKVAEVKERLGSIESDEQELGRKIERRRREMDQLQKRLAKLQEFRPPYMDEYEKFEAELRDMYAVYVSLFRNLHYLQSQLAQTESVERERAQDAERSMRVAVERMQAESEQSAPAIAGITSGMEFGETALEEEGLADRQSREIRVFGNMTGAGLSDDEDEEAEDDGGRIIEVEDEEEEEDEEEDGEEEEREIARIEQEMMREEEQERGAAGELGEEPQNNIEELLADEEEAEGPDLLLGEHHHQEGGDESEEDHSGF